MVLKRQSNDNNRENHEAKHSINNVDHDIDELALDDEIWRLGIPFVLAGVDQIVARADFTHVLISVELHQNEVENGKESGNET